MSLYCTGLRSRPGTARSGTTRPGSTGNWSRYCEANNFFISSPNELKLCTQIDLLLSCMFFQVAKMQRNIVLIFLNVFPKNIWAETSKNCGQSSILDTSYTCYNIGNPSQSVLTNVIAYNISGDHVLYSNFIQSFICLCFI